MPSLWALSKFYRCIKIIKFPTSDSIFSAVRYIWSDKNSKSVLNFDHRQVAFFPSPLQKRDSCYNRSPKIYRHLDQSLLHVNEPCLFLLLGISHKKIYKSYRTKQDEAKGSPNEQSGTHVLFTISRVTCFAASRSFHQYRP